MKPIKQGPIVDVQEVSEIRWVKVRAAMRLMTYEMERDLVKKILG
jgi:hypothetical protein